MHTQPAVNTSTAQADEDAEFRGSPLWRRCTAVATSVVPVCFLDLEELLRRVSAVIIQMKWWAWRLPLIAFQDRPPTWPCWPCCRSCDYDSHRYLRMGCARRDCGGAREVAVAVERLSLVGKSKGFWRLRLDLRLGRTTAARLGDAIFGTWAYVHTRPGTTMVIIYHCTIKMNATVSLMHSFSISFPSQRGHIREI